MTRISRIGILLGQVIFLTISLLISKNITCPFKFFFSVPCPFCGFTRSLSAVLTGNLKRAIYYNILCLPILFFLLAINTILIIEIIQNKSMITKKRIKFLYQNKKKFIIICLIMLIISTLINFYHRI